MWQASVGQGVWSIGTFRRRRSASTGPQNRVPTGTQPVLNSTAYSYTKCNSTGRQLMMTVNATGSAGHTGTNSGLFVQWQTRGRAGNYARNHTEKAMPAATAQMIDLPVPQLAPTPICIFFLVLFLTTVSFLIRPAQ